MTITPHSLQHESPADELAQLLVGANKSGKSWLAATGPGNLMFLDFDQRLAALRTHPNIKNIFGLTFADDPNTNKLPEAFNELLDILGRLEKSPLLRDLHSTFKDCGDKWVDTLIYDSVQTMSDSARRYVLYNGGGELERKFAIGGRVYRVPKTFHAWGGEMEMVTSAILQGRALLHCKTCAKSVTYKKESNGAGALFHTDPVIKDHEPVAKAMNVIVILHECMEEDERSTDENPIYTGKVEVFPRRYRTLLTYFNEVWRLTRENGKVPVIQVDPDGKFTKAATALGIVKPSVPNITTILNDAKSLRKVS